MNSAYYEKLLSCVDQVKARIDGFEPHIALTLGSGLGPVAEQMDVCCSVPYGEIEGMPVSTAPGHTGRFLFGWISGVPMVCMQGRLHYYEGYDVHDVVLPTRIMGLLGAKTLFLTNAGGGLEPEREVPALMVIRDHIMLHYPNPLVGPNLDKLGLRFPDMSAIYDPELSSILMKLGEEQGAPVFEGVYVQLTGPSFETPAEVRFLGSIGGGSVGMSTACEAVAARHMGMKVCGISCISNQGAGISPNPLTYEEVMENSDRISGTFSALVTAALPLMDARG